MQSIDLWKDLVEAIVIKFILATEIYISKFKTLFKYYFWAVSIAVVSHIIKEYFKVYDKQDIKSFDIERESMEMFLLLAIIAPIVEEFIFRFPLRKTSLFYFSILASCIFISDLKASNMIIACFIFVFWISLFWFQYSNSKMSILFVRIISILTFAIIHASNFNNDIFEANTAVNILFMFSSQLVMGVFLLKIRLEIGFLYAFLLHSFYNSSFFLISLNFK
jgi:hypothetical protein